jgi:hypothetical protein
LHKGWGKAQRAFPHFSRGTRMNTDQHQEFIEKTMSQKIQKHFSSLPAS